MPTLRNCVRHVKGSKIKKVVCVFPNGNGITHGYLLVVPINFKHMTSLKIISLIFRLMELPV
jgi:hypothetical protein